MGSNVRKLAEGGEGFLEGKLLIAMPGMPDPRFEKSVVFMCAHSAQGSMGIIVNKPIENLAFRDLMQTLNIHVTSNLAGGPILYGGPVNTKRGYVLHSAEYALEDATLPVTDDVSLTATVDVLRAMAEGRGPQKSLFALGCAGWDAGQIEDEIAGNGWIHCDMDAGLLFDAEPQEKWRTALGKLGIDVSHFSGAAGRA
jgi:putative transcriptional regulator